MRGAATRIARLGTQRAQGTTRPILVRRASSTTVDGRDKGDEGGSTVQRVTVSDSTGDDRLRKWEKRLEPALQRVTAQVDEALREIKELRTNVPTWVKAMEAVEKIAISKRKHLFRPQLVLLGFAAGSGQETWDFARELPEGLTAFAAGVELQHLFMFVHDDMMDNARTRRGHDTVHVAVAKSGRDSNEQTSRSSSSASSLRPSPLDPSSVQYLTTLVGDVLQAKSAALLASGERSMSSKGGTALPSAAEIVFAGALRAGAAQFDDILGWPGIERTLSLASLDAGNDNAVVDAEVSLMLRQIMDKASSHSFAAPLVGGLRLGAQVHPATSLDDLEECCLHWAEHAGAAFQALDDAMDLVLDPQDSGKDRLQDFQEGRLSVPLFVLRQKATPDEWNSVLQIFAAKALMTPSERHMLLKLASKYRLAEATLDVVDKEIYFAKTFNPSSAPLLAEGLDVFLHGLARLSASLRERLQQ